MLKKPKTKPPPRTVSVCYCWVCQARFYAPKGAEGSPPCPQGHTQTADTSWGKCPYCKSGRCWETSVKPVGRECVMHYFRCDTCGHYGGEPVD